MDPAEVESSMWARTIAGVVIRPCGAAATCASGSGRVIDFALVSRALRSAVKLELAEYSPWAPHFGLLLSVLFRPRIRHENALIRPKKLPEVTLEDEASQNALWNTATEIARHRLASNPILGAELAIEHSPFVLSRGPAAYEIGGEYAEWSLAAEQYTRMATGRSHRSWARYSGRGQFPVFRHQPTVDRRPSDAMTANWYHDKGADLWEQLHTSLTLYAKLRASDRGWAQQLRIEDFCMGFDPSDLDSIDEPPAAIDAQREWWSADTWTEALSHPYTLDEHNMKEAIRASAAIAKRLGSISQRKGTEGFQEWLCDSLSKGAGAIHRWSKQDMAGPVPDHQFDFTIDEGRGDDMATYLEKRGNLGRSSGSGTPTSSRSSSPTSMASATTAPTTTTSSTWGTSTGVSHNSKTYDGLHGPLAPARGHGLAGRGQAGSPRAPGLHH